MHLIVGGGEFDGAGGAGDSLTGKFGSWKVDAAAAIEKFLISTMGFVGVVEERILAKFGSSIACGMNLTDLSPKGPCYLTFEQAQKHFGVRNDVSQTNACYVEENISTGILLPMLGVLDAIDCF